jgi:hypothetical protein
VKKNRCRKDQHWKGSMNKRKVQGGRFRSCGRLILQHIPESKIRFPLAAAKGYERSQCFELLESLNPLLQKIQLVKLLLLWSVSRLSVRGGGRGSTSEHEQR